MTTGVAHAQDSTDSRAQYPLLLRNAFISLEVGGISQPFGPLTLEDGRIVPPPVVPRTEVRAVLLGREITPRFSVQGSYTRPARYVRYSGLLSADDPFGHRVRVSFGAVTLRARQPIWKNVSLFGDVGAGFTSRTGFKMFDKPVVKDAHYGSVVFGGGLDFKWTKSLNLTLATTYMPGRAGLSQPRTVLYSAGVRFTMRPLPPEAVARNQEPGVIFPANTVQLEYTSGYGYSVNRFFARKVPIFWGGYAEINRGGALHFSHNVFHTRRIFSLDVGASAATYRTRQNGERFHTLSFYPLFRFTFLRTKPADVYFAYSVAGPTYISRPILDGHDTGRRFTFQDFMGIGMYAGRGRHLNFNVKITHYSNGNILTQNAGVKIPLTYTVGYAF